MKKIIKILSICYLSVFVFAFSLNTAFGQETKDNNASKELSVKELLKKGVCDSTFLDVSNVHIHVFYNTGCGRCSMVTKGFKNRNIDFVEYNIKKSENKDIMFRLVEKTNKNKGFSYPVVVIDDSVYYSIPDLGGFISDTGKKYGKKE